MYVKCCWKRPPGFERVPCDWYVYIHHTPKGTVIFTVHIDKIFSIANPLEENICFWDQLKSKWDISDLGPAKFALGIRIKHDTDNLSLSQTAFIDRVIEQFGQADAYLADTPMVAGLQLQCPDKLTPMPPKVAKWIACTPYQELIGSLNYIAVTTCPDIAFAVS